MLEQFIGYLPDSIVGGSTLDTLTPAWAPVPNLFTPVTEVNAEPTRTSIDRDDEIRGEVDSVPPLAFREAWTVTVQGKLYPWVAKRLARLATGGVDDKTGTPPAAITHKLVPAGFGSFGLPATHIVVVRDDLAEAFGGCQLGSLMFDFPIDGEATYTATFLALYRKPLVGFSPPAESFADIEDWVYMLRDTDVFLDGAVSAMDALRGVQFTFDNQFRDPEFWPKRNREVVVDTGVKHIVWHPARRKRGTRRQITGRLMFSDVKPAQERRRDLAHAQKLVIETEAQDLTTTPAAKEMFRFTGQKMVLNSGGASAMTRDAEITSEYEFGIYRDTAIGSACMLEFVDGTNTAIEWAA